MSAPFLPATTVTAINALVLRGFATSLALRGRSVVFRYWDEGAGAMATRAAQTVLLTFDGESGREGARATQTDSELTATAWTQGAIEKEGTLTVAPGDTFLVDGFAATVTAVLPPSGGIDRARFTLGAVTAGAG